MADWGKTNMLSSNPLITETLALLLRHGIHDIVLCPGSRNAGIVHSICRVPDFRTYTATDERSAGFMAIGLADALRDTADRGVAVVVTSGSALANLYPAACEAFYRHVPVAFVSADRPAAWIGQMDGQTMPQAGALGAMTMMNVSLPGHDLWHANRLLNEALLCCTARRPQGPVHINIPIEEPIYDFTTPRLPEARAIRLCRDIGECFALPGGGAENSSETSVDEHGRIPQLIVCGQLRPEEVPAELLSGMQPPHCPAIVAENLSNLPPQLYTHADRVDWQRLPEVYRLVTVGGHIICKELKQHFRQHRPTEHWHVSEDGRVADLFRCHGGGAGFGTRLLPCHGGAGPSDEGSIPMPPMQRHLARRQADRIVAGLLRPAARGQCRAPGQQFVGAPGPGGHGALARQRRPQQPGRPVHTLQPWHQRHRGFSIRRRGLCHGQTADTYIHHHGRPVLLLRPQCPVDLSLPPNLHILLLNDGGGSIFDTMPLPPGYPDSRRAITGTHHLQAEHTALLHGLLYLRGRDRLSDFMRSTDVASLLEVVHE